MSLTVDVLAVPPAALVRLRVDVPGTWELLGGSEGRSWTVAKGHGPAWLSDPWAPLGVGASYTLTTGGATFSAGPILRHYEGRNLITDLAGRRAADFAWSRHGGGRREYDLGRTVEFTVPGSAFGASLAAPTAGAGGGALVARIEGDSNDRMDELVMSNSTLVLLHNEAQCQRPVCDIPRVQTVRLTQVSQDMTGRTDVNEREWSIAYRLAPSPWGYVPPVATLGELRARFPTVGALRDSGLTVGDVASGSWLVGS